MLQTHVLPILDDNYVFIIHDSITKKTAVVDPGEASPVIDFLERNSWQLDSIFITHHHFDHINGISELKDTYSCEVFCGKLTATRIPGYTTTLDDEQTFLFAGHEVTFKYLKGHTYDHGSFFFALTSKNEHWLFSGDTLFSLGCGRIFDGEISDLHKSLAWIKQLPPSTLIYFSHEYTLNNALFALSVDTQNKDLRDYYEFCKEQRKLDLPTVPTILRNELKCNPFLRCNTLLLSGETELEALTRLRQSKDKFST